MAIRIDQSDAPHRVRDVRRMLAAVAFMPMAISAPQQDTLTRRRLDAPQVVSGVSCDRTGRAYAEFYSDGSLNNCPLAADTIIRGHAFSRGTWVTLRRDGSLRSAWLSRDTRLGGHLCHGTGYKGFAVSFHDDDSLRSCYFARDTVIDGIPCIHGSFWTEIRGGTRSAVLFHPSGALAACQLSRNMTVSGRNIPKWSRVRRALDGSISEMR